ncbi:phage holin family protein [Amycolatopsis antarctica]|nr:phage holin family protein [Amycolatopsis antarctica]
MTRLSEQTSRLVRDELQLAQTEIKASAKHAGVGAGLFGVAGVLAWFGAGAIITTAIAALALTLPVWASALIVGAVLLIAAGIAALAGKKQVRQTSPTPERTLGNVKRDVQEVQEARHRDHAQQS